MNLGTASNLDYMRLRRLRNSSTASHHHFSLPYINTCITLSNPLL